MREWPRNLQWGNGYWESFNNTYILFVNLEFNLGVVPKFCQCKFILSIQISAWFHWYTQIIFKCWRFFLKDKWQTSTDGFDRSQFDFVGSTCMPAWWCLLSSSILEKVTKFYISYQNPSLGLRVEITLEDITYWTYFQLH